MPSQADEEAHQLSYLQKHMANILTLLADSVDGSERATNLWLVLFFTFIYYYVSIYYLFG